MWLEIVAVNLIIRQILLINKKLLINQNYAVISYLSRNRQKFIDHKELTSLHLYDHLVFM